jgi:hypothetical protein
LSSSCARPFRRETKSSFGGAQKIFVGRPTGRPWRAALALPTPAGCRFAVLLLLLLAPVFMAFEVGQLVLCERYLGIKQIARGADPRELGLGEAAAFSWTATLFAYWLWMLFLLALPYSRLDGVALLIVTTLGFSLRRGAPLKWILVILTFEGAIRIGLLLYLCALVWRRF